MSSNKHAGQASTLVDAVIHKPEPNDSRRIRWGVGRKTAIVIAASVCVGFIGQLALQTKATQDRALDRFVSSSVAMSELLASQISGALRWKKADVVERAYVKLAADPKSDLASLSAFDVGGEEVSKFKSGRLRTVDLSGIKLFEIKDAKPVTRVEIDGTHLVVVAPVLNGKSNALVGTLVTAWSLRHIQQSVRSMIISQLVVAGIILLGVVVVLIIFLGRTVSKPLRKMTSTMTAITNGDLETDVPYQSRNDEIGLIASSVHVFKESLIENLHLQVERQEAEKKAQEEEKRRTAVEREAADKEVQEKALAATEQRQRTENMEQIIATFDREITTMLEAVTSAANQMRSSAEAMTYTADQTNRQSAAAAAATEEASTNMQTVASAAEELSASVQEIGRQVTESSKVAQTAVTEASATNERVQGLAEAAQKIGDVVNLINDIASQTNLLALNATIEAARASDAGKGFAVVASEVKSLATQTGKATEEIGGQIAAIQQATEEAVTAIEGISGVIGQISDISTAISSAVEEQGSSTREIASNVQLAAAGTQAVTGNIAEVNQAASETGQAAAQVLNAADELAKQGDALRNQVDNFLQSIRAA